MIFSPLPNGQRLQLRLSERRVLLMAGDVLAVIIAVLIALFVWSVVGRYRFTFDFVWPRSHWFVTLTGLWLLLASANDFYELRISASRMATFQRLVLITLQMLVIYLVVFFLAGSLRLPRLFILYYGGASFVLIAVFRLLNPALAGWASQRRRVLVVGTDRASAAIINTIAQEAQQVYDIRGIVGENGSGVIQIGDVPLRGTGKDLLRLAHEEGVSELIVTSTHALTPETFAGLMDAYEAGLTIVPMPLLYERITGQVPVEYLMNNWSVVLPIEGETIFDLYPVIKRLTDILLSLVGAVALALLLPPLALIIKLDSPGAVFYSQERVGINGRIFRVYKFRSMRANAEATTGAVFSREGDPRITRVGRFMRKTRLDEGPQVINILRGDMSVIGPRPERPEHVQRLVEKIPFYRTRHIIRPGLTGWAQVRYKYGSTDEDALVKLQYDLYYIRHQSLALDLNIMVRTVGKVIRMGGT
ncbi:MAG TPA: sugar transferase [Phototrophicaceae bacterium]|nr:sugar transferase [Phototrophicaceae bacterium]